MNRALSYLIALLVLANVGLLLWPQDADDAPHVYPAKKDVNPQFVRWNKEIEERFYGDTSEQNFEIPTLAGVESQLLESVSPESPDASSGECYRVGPFLHEANY